MLKVHPGPGPLQMGSRSMWMMTNESEVFACCVCVLAYFTLANPMIRAPAPYLILPKKKYLKVATEVTQFGKLASFSGLHNRVSFNKTSTC